MNLTITAEQHKKLAEYIIRLEEIAHNVALPNEKGGGALRSMSTLLYNDIKCMDKFSFSEKRNELQEAGLIK